MCIKGKKISILGDSISTYRGYSDNGKANITTVVNGVYYAPPFSVDETYWMRIIRRLGLELCVNNSWSGGLLSCDGDDSIAGIERSKYLRDNDGNSPDIIVLFMGINDLGYGVDADKFGAAYRKTLKYIVRGYSEAEVFCVGLPNRTPYLAEMTVAYNDAIIFAITEAGKRFHYVDWFNSKMSGEIYDKNSLDGLHPSAKGMEMLAEIIEREMVKVFSIEQNSTSRIFVTGDTHGNDVFKLHTLAKNHPELTKNDYVIIAGDFGAVWSKKDLEQRLKLYTDMPFTVLFVDGNHENFDLIESYPVEEWQGGKVHKIKPDVIHLMRGQVYEIAGKTFFTFGGATSIDKDWRVEGVSWWPQELPTGEDLDEAVHNLKAHDNTVDYIITHSCGMRALMYPPLYRSMSLAFPENHMLSYFEDFVKFRHWYFGHYHEDAQLSDKYTVLLQNVIEIK